MIKALWPIANFVCQDTEDALGFLGFCLFAFFKLWRADQHLVDKQVASE